MKRLFSLIFLLAILFLYVFPVYAACTTQTIITDRAVIVCTTCCSSPGNCVTNCV